jgi:HK97 family phage major capsid protein
MPELEDRIGALEATIREAAALKASNGKADAALPDLSKQLIAGLEAKAETDAAKLRDEMKTLVAESVKAALLDVRTPSVAAQAGPGPAFSDAVRARFDVGASPALKASLGDNYRAGTLLTGIMNLGTMDGDRTAGKATLAELGLGYLPAPEGKATLGTTGATGGYVLPNNLVATLVKPPTQRAVYTGANPLVTVIPGVMVRGIDQPYRTGSPSRWTAQNWGATKTNIDEAYGTYTATLGTFAAIYDIGKQYAHFSAGAAEADVLDELTKGAALAENFAVIAGPGTGSATPGVNDPTKGVYTSLLGNVYTTAHTASSSTVAGSAAQAIATGWTALLDRNRDADAVVMDATSFGTIWSQGSDSAGFWMSEFLGAGFSIGGDNTLRWRGIPIYHDSNFDANAASKAAIIGEWKALKFYRGMEFRVDSSDIAGDRWDKNLIGFRGEEEFGVNADTAVAVGAFQLITGIIP